jgi:hypothetical protein
MKDKQTEIAEGRKVPAQFQTIAPFPVVHLGGQTLMAYLDDVAHAVCIWREKNSEPDPPYGAPPHESFFHPSFKIMVAKHIAIWFKRLGVQWDKRGIILGYEEREGAPMTITWDIPQECSSLLH